MVKRIWAVSLMSLVVAVPPLLAKSPTYQSRATQFVDKPAIAVGVAWYPEQWPESRWDVDLTLMKNSGFNTVRIGEFAWSRIEPTEGQFDFIWMDRAVAAAKRHGFMIVIGTPSAAPPAWLTQKYPDTLRVDENGMRAGHGGRRHFSFASARYRDLSRRIAVKMATRYGKDSSVVGWQIDNEVGPPSFDAESVAAWHRFLEQRYRTIDNLNTRWTTQYWSQHYNDFDQVPLHATGQQNPGLLLDFRHFTSATWTNYVQNQVQAIRPLIDSRAFITTNTMFWNAGFDHFQMHRDLDIASWDNYVQEGRPDWVANGANHDLVRGYKRRNFWLMETQPGRVDWALVNRSLDPGQTREMAWQAVSHGADAVLYWQWRSPANGQEVYHGAVLGQDGLPNPVHGEITQMAKELTAASPLLADTQPVGKVGMLFSYDSRWAIDLQRHNKAFDPIKSFIDTYRPLRIGSQGVHILSADDDLCAYPLVVAPNLNVVTQAQADRLAAYVRDGGHLLLGARSGMKDDANALWPQRQPGPLADLLGAQVEQYYALDETIGVKGAITGTASIWAEALKPIARDVDVMATYDNGGGWLDGKPALVTRKVGKGRITYLGAWLEPAAMRQLAARLLADAKVQPLVANAHPDLEISERAGKGKRVMIVINHGNEARPLLPPPGAKLSQGQWQNGQLAAHGVALFELR